MKQDNNVLVIGDVHAPAYHQDTVHFLSAVKKKFNPQRVILTGDEINWESISFHTKNPDLPSPSDELKATIKSLQPIYNLFPKADILESNHGSLVFRKAIAAGLPTSVIRSYREMIAAPKKWNWHFELTLQTALGPIYFHHGKSSSIEKLSKSMGMSSIQGHYHSKFYVSYWASPIGLFWDANAGAFADHKHMAMAYAKNSINKSIMGCIMIQNGIPQLLPMVLNKRGRWIGRL
jgi:hypothetical protein